MKIPPLLKKEPLKVKPFEETNTLVKLYLYVVIVPFGNSKSITKIMSRCKSSIQLNTLGEGTANADTRSILGLDDNRKDVVFSIVSEDNLKDIKVEIEAYFNANKKNRGIGFAIPFSSVLGIKYYKYLTQTI